MSIPRHPLQTEDRGPGSRRSRGLPMALVLCLAGGPGVLAQGIPAPVPGADPTGPSRTAPIVKIAGTSTNGSDIERMISTLPILPPEKAGQRFAEPIELSGLTVEAFLILMSRPELLGMNIVLAARTGLDRPVDIFLADMTLGEVFDLVLQLNNLKALRFNESTLIVVEANSRSTFGVRQEKLYRLTYTTPENVLNFIRDNQNLNTVLLPDRLIRDDRNNTLLAVDTADNLRLLDHVIALLDAKTRKITARIPVSHIELSDIQGAIGNLPQEIGDRLNTDEMVFSEDGRTLIVFETPEDVQLLRDLIRNIDIGRKQALIDASIMEVSQTVARDLGLQLIDSSLTVTTLDRLWNLDRLRNAIAGTSTSSTQLSYLLQKQGGNTIANPKVRVIDGESATINIGQIRNVRVQTAQFSANQTQTTQQTTFNTQEVPIGVTLNVTPTIHNDGTVSLELDVSDEAIITINDFGVDRTTRNTNSRLRMRDGETVIMGGFINRTVSYDRTPIPILGQIPLLKSLFRRNQRQKVGSELVILLTPYILDYNPVLPKAEAELLPPGKPIDTAGYSQETIKPQTKTTLTRWVDGKDSRTKVVYDAQGQVVYQRDFARPKDEAAPPEAAPGNTPRVTVETGPKADFSDLYGEPLTPPDGSSGSKPAADKPAPRPTSTPAATPVPGRSSASAPAEGEGDEWKGLMEELGALLPPSG